MISVLRSALEPLIAALVTGRADPRPTPSRLVLPRGGGEFRWLPFRRLDLVALADAGLALAVYQTTYLQLRDVNAAASAPVAQNDLRLWAALSAFPLLLRARWPLAAWRSATALLLLVGVPMGQLLDDAFSPSAALMYLLCLYSVAARCDRTITAGVWTLSAFALLVLDPARAMGGALLMGVPILLGANVRGRRLAETRLDDQTRLRAQDQTALAVLEERSRIARELHDVVAHHMSVIAIQAEAAPLRSPDAPAALRADLAEIRSTALAALDEMRRILGVLREEGAADTAPQPGLGGLDDLVAATSAAGLSVTTTMTGTARPVPPGVALSAYRIVQESLSNVMQHAPGAEVAVELAYQDRPLALRLRVENGPAPDGRAGPARDGPRHGLIGMTERARLLGGDLQAGPTPAGGFALVATLPLPAP